MILKLFRAVDAFLYLPTYIAQDLDILGTLLRDLGITKVIFNPPNDNDNGVGDINAIKSMYYSSNSDEEETISIAICSPSALLSRDIEQAISSNCRVIAGLINKLPFWGINHRNKEFENLQEIEDEFDNVIYYKKELVEGHCLGESLRNSPKINKGTAVNWGEEIELLDKINDPAHKTIAISADIVKIVKVTERTKNRLHINYRYSKDSHYLATGLITTKEACENHKEILCKVIEGIQKSITLLYSSEKLAIDICDNLKAKFTIALEDKIKKENPEYAQDKINNQIEKEIPTREELKAIIKMINKEKFYPANLQIDIKEWKDAVTSISIAENWILKLNRDRIDEIINKSFYDFVDNNFIQCSQRSLAKQLGIDEGTFTKEISEKIKENSAPLNQKINELNKKVNDLELENDELKNKPENLLTKFIKLTKRNLKFILLLITATLISLGIYLLAKYWVDENITRKDIFLAIIFGAIAAIIGGIVIEVLRKKIFKDVLKRRNERENP